MASLAACHSYDTAFHYCHAMLGTRRSDLVVAGFWDLFLFSQDWSARCFWDPEALLPGLWPKAQVSPTCAQVQASCREDASSTVLLFWGWGLIFFEKMLKKPRVGFLNQGRYLGMLCGRAGKRGRVPGAAMPGCCVPGLVAAEDLQDFAQVLRVGSFQVQMVMNKFRRLLP